MAEMMKGTKANKNFVADMVVLVADSTANPTPAVFSCANSKKVRDRLSPKMKGDVLPKQYNCAMKACGCGKSGVI